MTTIDAPTVAAREVAAELVERLEQAWNQADGAAFARDFADDADFVNIRGEHHTGQPAIAAGHQGIFDTIYKGSTNRLELESARLVAPGSIVAVVRSTLEAPVGPLHGTNQARFTLVLVERGGRWEVEAFHNTLVLPAS
jgi:uncharacterized protein (TIGR02246 family)